MSVFTPGLTVLRLKCLDGLTKFCPLRYKTVISMRPRRIIIKDYFSLVFSKFSKIVLVAAHLWQVGKTLKMRVKINP